MAVVLAGYTILQLLSMAASAGSFGTSIATIVKDLRASGHPDDKPIPLPAQQKVRTALDQLPQPLPADFGQLAASDQVHVQAALEAVRAVYIADVTVNEYRADALAALYKLAEYLDDHA